MASRQLGVEARASRCPSPRSGPCVQRKQLEHRPALSRSLAAARSARERFAVVGPVGSRVSSAPLARALVGAVAHAVEQLVEVALQDVVELVQRDARAVIGDAGLREVVGADLLAAVARARPARGARSRAPRQRARCSTSSSRARRIFSALRLVLVLALLVLARDDDAGRDVRDAHGRVGRVHALAARARRRGRRRCAGPRGRS